jgi:hypothetical protein
MGGGATAAQAEKHSTKINTHICDLKNVQQNEIIGEHYTQQ